MNSIIDTTTTTITITDLLGLEAVSDCWEDLADALSEEDSVPTPIEPPASPRVVLQEATMDIVVTEVSRTQPKKPVPSPRSKKTKKTKGKKMTLAEYYAECERQQAEMLRAKEKAKRLEDEAKRLEEEKNRPSAKTLRNRRKKERVKAKKEAKKTAEKKSWTPVKKAEVKSARISLPQGWTKSLYKPSGQKGKLINTTLILKNLPYEGTTERDLKHFFSKTCGPVKFVNVLYDGDRCKGIAFVRFENVSGSDKGLTMNGFWYEDRRVYVEYARDRRTEK